MKPKGLQCIKGQTRRPNGPFWPLKLHKFVINILFSEPNTFASNCSLPFYRTGCIWTWQTRPGELSLLCSYSDSEIFVFSPDLRLLLLSPASYATMCIDLVHMQHSVLASLLLLIWDPHHLLPVAEVTEREREIVELCYTERTLLYSRSCDRSRISKCGLMQYPPSPAGRPDPTQGQTHHMAQSADTHVLLMMFRVPSKGTYCDLSKKKRSI